MMALAEREAAPREPGRASGRVPIVLGTAAIVVTHHLTSYALVVFLAALALGLLVRLRKTGAGPTHGASPSRRGAGLAWLLLVASSTFGYLSPSLERSLRSDLQHRLRRGAAPRSLPGPRHRRSRRRRWLRRAVALLAVVLLARGLPFGLRRVWQRYRAQPFALIFVLASLGFFGTLALRLAPAAWETGNRASEFLFIGLAFVLAGVGLRALARRRARPGSGGPRLTAALGIVLVGGAISGWPWDPQLARPLRASAEGAHDLLAAAGAGRMGRAATRSRTAASRAGTADARLLLAPGEQDRPGRQARRTSKTSLENRRSQTWEMPLLREQRHALRGRRPPRTSPPTASAATSSPPTAPATTKGCCRSRPSTKFDARSPARADLLQRPDRGLRPRRTQR